MDGNAEVLRTNGTVSTVAHVRSVLDDGADAVACCAISGVWSHWYTP